MSKNFGKKCTSALACFAIVVLGAIIIFVWIQFGQGAFRTKQHHSIFNISRTKEIEQMRVFNGTRHHKEIIEKTHLGDIGPGNEVELVKPLRIMTTVPNETDNLKEKPFFIRHRGHFRHKQSEIWDKHPHYEIEAFGQKLYLELDYNDNFLPNLEIVTHFRNDTTEKINHDSKVSGCFYTGKIRGDKESSVTVSLCEGMTGLIQSSQGSYYIEPAEKYTNTTQGSVIHRIKKLYSSNHDSNDIASADSQEFFENSENHTVIEDVFYTDIIHRPKQHRIRRDVVHDEDRWETVGGKCDAVPEGVWTNVNEDDRHWRTIRNAEWSPGNINEYFVKVLIVADSSMLEYHRTYADLQHYIFTLMHTVSFLYKHETIGNAITIHVSGIRILANEQDFSRKKSPDMLDAFCKWQYKNIKDSSHNVAVLLTKNIICSNKTSELPYCTTIGVANVGSMCTSGCAIVSEKGLATSFVIAHEIGHVLSMVHDEDIKCRPYNKHQTNNIMKSVVTPNITKPFTWSNCSKHFVSEFLRSHRADCLKIPPPNTFEIVYTDMLPGDKFNLSAQCELEFGKGYQFCETDNMVPCEHLQCARIADTYCRHTFSPWADGTKCGPRRVCFNGECKLEKDIIARDGAWGPWSDNWGPCSRTCGGGIRKSFRECNSPKPAYGGKYCSGANVRYESCNTHDCVLGSPDFRTLQCDVFSNATVKWYAWMPDYEHGKYPASDWCKLYCISNTTKTRVEKSRAVDGTKCSPTGFGICINGDCRQGGCDNKLDSMKKLDDCGICDGDNSRCHEMNGNYNIPGQSDDYYFVTRIPKGSSNLNITQDSFPVEDQNYLVLIDEKTGEYLLNGNHNVKSNEYVIKFGEVEITYSGSSSPLEWITSPKYQRLPGDLILQVLTGGKMSPPNIHYRYVIDRDDAPRYGWRLYGKQWSKCNSICDGKQFRKPVCVDLATGTEMMKHFCDSSEEMHTQKQECNTHCELTWNVASRSACNPSCGQGLRRVSYNCMKVAKKKPNHSEIVDDKHCTTLLTKPSGYEQCDTICNSTRWHYSSWSKCSKSCGGGIQTRTAKCIDDSNTHIDDLYCKNSEMVTEQICNTENCPTWSLIDESPCSVSCGGGYKNLTYHCMLDGRFSENACDLNSKPQQEVSCNKHACGRWAATKSYFKCSVTCGEGIERRIYVCKKFDSEETVNESYCEGQNVPNESRVCFLNECNGIRDEFDNFIKPEPYGNYNSYQWVPGEWSSCSQSCGSGIMRQEFYCRDALGNENSDMCDYHDRPKNIEQCNVQICPRWKTGTWSACNSNCERLRQVRCFDHTNTIVSDDRCNLSNKPYHSVKCKLSECPNIINTIPSTYFTPLGNENKRFRWKVGQWKKCSNTCGKGTRRRHVECTDSLNDITVVDQFCDKVKKPKMTKQCEKYSCKYTWMEGYWSSCSKKCGSGTKSRNVTCHKVHPGGIIDPVPLPDVYQSNQVHQQNYCTVHNKPSTIAKCMISYCGDEYMWQPEPWKECSHKCGRKGRQTRILNCVSVRNKERVPRYMCRKELKPPRKRKCNQMKCLYKSCREIKHYLKTKENKDYIISLRGRPVQIYCYKMDTLYPQEYISLHPDKSNYAEFYEKRLIDVRTCPYNGAREEHCQCDNVGPERSGFTKFWKVRLNITSMQIIGEDYTFSRQVKGTQIPYGTAGDCYSSVLGCAQGQFSVDLSHTSFKLSNTIKWEKLGSYASMYIHRTETVATGSCGGYCGNCIPDPNIGLAVEIT